VVGGAILALLLLAGALLLLNFVGLGTNADDANRFRISVLFNLLTVFGAIAIAWVTYLRARAADRQAAASAAQVEVQRQTALDESEQRRADYLLLAKQIDQQGLDAARQGESTAKQVQLLATQVEQQRSSAETEAQQRREEHSTERYGRAIEQLGHNRIEVRIGGIYALEALAVDSGERWAATVYENLVAYLKEHTRPVPDQPEGAGLSSISTDVHAILSVLSRQRALFDANLDALAQDNQVQFGEGTPPPSTGAHLVGTDLDGARLEGADFSRATLTGVSFLEAALDRVRFTGATLTNTGFYGASLGLASFRNANVTACAFIEAQLYMTMFTEAILTSADFRRATLSVVDFGEAVLNDVYFHRATFDPDVHFGQAKASAITMNHLKDFDVDPLPDLIT